VQQFQRPGIDHAKAAEAGLPEAEYHIGRLYLQGSGVPYSQSEATRWLERSALHGNVEAQCLLAALLVQGLASAPEPSRGDGAARLFAEPATDAASATPNFDAALKWARMAAQSGSADAQALLGYVLTYGPDHLRNQDEARDWYQRSASGGCPQGHLGYALALAGDAKLSDRKGEIAQHIRLAADTELPTAVYMLGVLTEGGAGVEKDPAAATGYYQSAAELGHCGAQVKWGTALIEGKAVTRDPVLGESWLRRAALAGDARAAEMVGDLYTKGGALPPNYAEAASWYRRAALARISHTA
jgi:TPR repeat protein